MSSSSGAVRALGGQWEGADFDALRAHWPSADEQLARMGAHLGELSRRLVSNAQQQRGASGSSVDAFAGVTAGGTAPGTAPAVGHTTPRPQQHWWDKVGDAVGDAGAGRTTTPSSRP